MRARLAPLAAAAGAALALSVVGAVAWFAFSGGDPPPPPELTLPRAGGPDDPSPGTNPGAGRAVDGGAEGDGGAAGGGDGEPSVVVVHVAGAVARPGLYRLAAAERLADAITAAGGPAADADVDAVNLAAVLVDGARLYVPRKGEAVVADAGAMAPSAAPGTAGAGRATAPLDLNTATEAELEELPGIGPATAAAIVAHRREHGRFGAVDELLEVRGIGAAKLAQIRPLVRAR